MTTTPKKRTGKIERLTPEQEAELPAFRQRYLDIACGGGRIDRPALEAALADAYAVIGKPAPKLFIFDSPAACMLALKILKMPPDKILGANLWANLWANLRENLGANLWENLGANLGANLRANLLENLWANLRENLLGNLGANLWENLRANLGANLRANLLENLLENLWANLRENLGANLWENLGANLYDGNYLWGSQDLFWIAYYRFAQKIGCVYDDKDAHRLDIMERISTQCEWWWPRANIVVASERPRSVRWDDENRLHREDGPAVEYADGYSLYMWHGTRIPEQWITDPTSLTAKDALTHENIEQRRAACEILGWARILRELDAKVIDADKDPLVGELVEAQLPDLDRRSKFLRVRCGTGREFAIGLPPEIKTALEGQAWLTGLPVEQFQLPSIRT